MRRSLTAYGMCTALLLLAFLIGRMLPAERIIFLSDDDGPLKLYGMDIGRGLIHKLNDVEILWTYSLSPDGQYILYAKTLDMQPGIFVMDFDGKNSHQLVAQPAINPTWSSDSRAILFASYSSKNAPTQIYQVQTDGTDLSALTQIMPNKQAVSAIWSPDRKQILFEVVSANNEVSSYFMNADGSAVRQLAYPTRFIGIAYPQWSPDGQWVAFIGMSASTENQAVTGLLCVAKVDAAQLSCSDNYVSSQLNWSPDSQRIAFISSKGYNIYNVEIFDVETGDTQRILRYGEYSGINGVQYPIWTADGTRLIYQVSSAGHGTQLHIVNVDGSGEQNLTGGLITSVLPTWWAGE